MAVLSDWDSIDPGSGSGKKNFVKGENDKYLKLAGTPQGATYRFRPVGKPCTFYSYYVSDANDPKKFNRALTEDPQNCVIRSKYNTEPKTRYAVNVIDRADGKLKIMEAPPTVFDQIKSWAKASGKNPGTKDGADFMVSVTVPSSGDRKRTEYKTTCIGPVPFTEDEMAMLKKKGLFDLEKEFAPTPQDQIEAKLYPHTAAASAPAANQKKVTSSVSDPNDLGF